MHQLVPFFKFFFEPKTDIFSSIFLCDHYALILMHTIYKIYFVIFRFDLFKTRKIFEKMDKNRCPKMRSTKDFWEKTRGTR